MMSNNSASICNVGKVHGPKTAAAVMELPVQMVNKNMVLESLLGLVVVADGMQLDHKILLLLELAPDLLVIKG
jgi:hypothetical protein